MQISVTREAAENQGGDPNTGSNSGWTPSAGAEGARPELQGRGYLEEDEVIQRRPPLQERDLSITESSKETQLLRLKPSTGNLRATAQNHQSHSCILWKKQAIC